MPVRILTVHYDPARGLFEDEIVQTIDFDECEPENEKIKNLHWAELSDDYAHCLDLVISGMKAQYAQENNKVRIRSVETKKTSASTKTESITQMEFQWIEGGCFMMGQTKGEKKQIIDERGEKDYEAYYKRELPRHEVCVNGFWMAKYPMTVGQFRLFVQATGHQTDAEKAGESYTLKDNQWQTVNLPHQWVHFYPTPGTYIMICWGIFGNGQQMR